MANSGDEDLHSIVSEEIDQTQTDSTENTDSDDGDPISGQIESLSRKPKGYKLEITEETADFLYCQAGSVEKEKNRVFVMPSPHVLRTREELLILEAETDLSIEFSLDEFQMQALLSLLNGHNSVVLTPCGSGKIVIFYLGVHIL